MNFQQLRYVRAAVQNDLNLTKVASQLFTSQSGVSKQIKELEAQLQLEIFVRRGKRLTGVTEAGRAVVSVIERLLQEADNLRKLSEQFAQADRGQLVIATTHNQASYVLPQVLLRFVEQFPDVRVELRQSSPDEIVQALLLGEADLGIATEALEDHAGLRALPCFSWDHLVVVPPGHPLADKADLTLADVAAWPIITYSAQYTGRSKINGAFNAAGLEPDIRLTAVDADVIKTYVRLGLGVGIIAQMALDPASDATLVPLRASRRLFPSSTTKVAFPANALLRNYTYRMIEALAPHLDEKALRKLARTGGDGSPTQPLQSYDQRADLRPLQPGITFDTSGRQAA
jgi:LysR family cys regulon transcriptional activator